MNSHEKPHHTPIQDYMREFAREEDARRVEQERLRAESEEAARKKREERARFRRDAEIARQARKANVAIDDEGNVVPPDDLRH